MSHKCFSNSSPTYPCHSQGQPFIFFLQLLCMHKLKYAYSWSTSPARSTLSPCTWIWFSICLWLPGSSLKFGCPPWSPAALDASIIAFKTVGASEQMLLQGPFIYWNGSAALGNRYLWEHTEMGMKVNAIILHFTVKFLLPREFKKKITKN